MDDAVHPERVELPGVVLRQGGADVFEQLYQRLPRASRDDDIQFSNIDSLDLLETVARARELTG